jgi:hypothetical protein
MTPAEARATVRRMRQTLDAMVARDERALRSGYSALWRLERALWWYRRNK